MCMAVERFSITMEPTAGAAVRAAAAEAGVSVSAWLAAAAADRLLNQRLGRALDAWEAEQGEFSPDELRKAAHVLERRAREAPSAAQPADDAA